jgi:hypothetical protein
MTKLSHSTFGALEQSSYGNWDGQIPSKEGKSIKISFDFHPLEDTELASSAERHIRQILANELEHRTKTCTYMLALGRDWYETEDEAAPKN